MNSSACSDEKGGFILAHWDGTPETEEQIKAETKATIRCIPVDAPEEDGVCIISGKPRNVGCFLHGRIDL